jgi:hypothetical protein
MKKEPVTRYARSMVRAVDLARATHRREL